MTRLLAYLIGLVCVLIALSWLVGFSLALQLVFLIATVATGILFYQWTCERRRLKRRHSAGGMTGWEVRLPYGETESSERMSRLIGYSTKFDSFVLAYVGESIEDRNNNTKVLVEFRFVIDPRQAAAARKTILQEYPDAFVSEVQDEASEQLIARYLELHPYIPFYEILRQKWQQLGAARRRLQTG
jgi:hypothetical protein